MFSTYHLSSAQELNNDIIEAIKTAFKSKAITITIEDHEENTVLTDQMKQILDERLNEDSSTYITAKESLDQLREKYGL